MDTNSLAGNSVLVLPPEEAGTKLLYCTGHGHTYYGTVPTLITSNPCTSGASASSAWPPRVPMDGKVGKSHHHYHHGLFTSRFPLPHPPVFITRELIYSVPVPSTTYFASWSHPAHAYPVARVPDRAFVLLSPCSWSLKQKRIVAGKSGTFLAQRLASTASSSLQQPHLPD
jgi:hypothetical protein